MAHPDRDKDAGGKNGIRRANKRRKANTLDHLMEFLAGESGATGVDWIVLTALCVALGLAVAFTMDGSVGVLVGEASGIMSNYQIDEVFDSEN
jgi:hypothetical protein